MWHSSALSRAITGIFRFLWNFSRLLLSKSIEGYRIVMSKLIIITCLVLTTLLGLACAMKGERRVLTDLALRHVIAEYIERDEKPAVRAKRVQVGAIYALGVLDKDEETSLGELEQLIKQRVGFDSMPPARKLLVNDLLALARAALEQQTDDKLSPETRVRVKRFARLARNTAAAYLEH